MQTVEQLKKYIFSEYSVSPIKAHGNILEYRAIIFEKNTASIILANKEKGELWTIRRKGHSIDFFRPEELETAIAPGGSLLYYFLPESRM
jgi:hypothetical protein